jgi:hypothetical protein
LLSLQDTVLQTDRLRVVRLQRQHRLQPIQRIGQSSRRLELARVADARHDLRPAGHRVLLRLQSNPEPGLGLLQETLGLGVRPQR